MPGLHVASWDVTSRPAEILEKDVPIAVFTSTIAGMQVGIVFRLIPATENILVSLNYILLKAEAST